MIKNISRLEHKIGDRVFHLLCDSDSPISEVKESILEFLKYLGRIEDSVKSAQEQQKEEIQDESEKEESSPEAS